MACEDYKCIEKTSSNCIIWGGEDIECLDICKGKSTLTDIIDAIYSCDDGITYTIPTFCTFISDNLSTSTPSLSETLQAFSDSICSLNESIEGIVPVPETWDTKCLPGTLNTRQQVIQAIIDKLCSIVIPTATTPTTILTQNGDYGVTRSTTQQNTVTFKNLLPPKAMMFCWDAGALQYFDSTGKGLISVNNSFAPYANWWICNGLNGTPDMRGFGAFGATSLPGINGATLNPIVDAAQHGGDVDYNSTIGQVKGEFKHATTAAENGPHTHTGSVSFSQKIPIAPPRVAGGNICSTDLPNNSNAFVSIAGTFTTDSSGTGTPHNNLPPARFGFWITTL